MKLDFHMFHLGHDPEITICVTTNIYPIDYLSFQYLVSGHGRFCIASKENVVQAEQRGSPEAGASMKPNPKPTHQPNQTTKPNPPRH